jgi:hypothetical protein
MKSALSLNQLARNFNGSFGLALAALLATSEGSKAFQHEDHKAHEEHKY